MGRPLAGVTSEYELIIVILIPRSFLHLLVNVQHAWMYLSIETPPTDPACQLLLDGSLLALKTPSLAIYVCRLSFARKVQQRCSSCH